MTKQFENKLQEIIDEACDECEYSTDGCESLFLESQVKDIVKKAIEGIWHKPSEEPDHSTTVIFSAIATDGSGVIDIGFWNHDEKRIVHAFGAYRISDTFKWAYYDDLHPNAL